jgi:hypothetical protein
VSVGGDVGYEAVIASKLAPTGVAFIMKAIPHEILLMNTTCDQTPRPAWPA